MRVRTPDAVLFDLDGTLIDSAGDLGVAANRMRVERGLEELPLTTYRKGTSNGGRGVLKTAFGITPKAQEYAQMLECFYSYYGEACCVHTALFPGIEQVLCLLEQHGIPWGIVTNKHRRFTEPVLAALKLDIRCACVVCGDDTPHPKPAPDPLNFACRQMNVSPKYSVYVGDDRRDIEAGTAAGMITIAAGYGYLGETPNIDTWHADFVVLQPEALLNHLCPEIC